MMDTLLGAEEKPSAFKINQFLRGELFSVVNSLLMNDIKPLEEELAQFYLESWKDLHSSQELPTRCTHHMTKYFECSPNNKYAYLGSYKIALIYSLQELLYLVNMMLGEGNATPKLLKVNLV